VIIDADDYDYDYDFDCSECRYEVQKAWSQESIRNNNSILYEEYIKLSK
jgi:hypothetical protein